MKGGVKGGGAAVLRSKEEMHLAFAEQAKLLAGGDLWLKNAILRCEVKCNGTVKLVSPKGNLVGGTAAARDGLEVADLGSKRGVKTSISFGQNYLVGDRISVEERQVAELQQRSAEMSAEMNRIERRGGSRKDLQVLGRKKVAILKAIERKSFRILTLKEMFERHYPSKIVVRGTLYPGVVVESHGRYLDVKAPKEKVVLYFNEKLGKIEQEDLAAAEPTGRRPAVAAGAGASP